MHVTKYLITTHKASAVRLLFHQHRILPSIQITEKERNELEFYAMPACPLYTRVCKIAKIAFYLRRIWLSACKNSASTGRMLIKLDIWVFFENRSRKNQVSFKS